MAPIKRGGANSVKLMNATDMNDVKPKVAIKLANCKDDLLFIWVLELEKERSRYIVLTQPANMKVVMIS